MGYLCLGMLFLVWPFKRNSGEIANAGSANGEADLGICNGFPRNGALYNGPAGNPS